MGEIAIRRAVAGDAERLNDALRRLSEDIGDSHAGTPALLARAGFGDHPAFRALLAENASTIVGAALYSPVFSTVRAGAGAYVSDLWTAPEARGKGLGRRLLAAVGFPVQDEPAAGKMGVLSEGRLNEPFGGLGQCPEGIRWLGKINRRLFALAVRPALRRRRLAEEDALDQRKRRIVLRGGQRGRNRLEGRMKSQPHSQGVDEG